MIDFLQRLKSPFRFRAKGEVEDAVINDALQQTGRRLHNADPETRQQWLRLQRTLARDTVVTKPVRPRVIPRLAFGAGAIAIALVGLYLAFPLLQPSPDTFATGKGERMQIVLNDGSEVTLSYATELVAPMLQVDKPRRVSLSGEAYFHVKRNETPFIISTPYAEVEVLGTEFNLRTREGTLEVAVISGIVRVGVVRDGKDSTVTLTQNQMALCPQDGFPAPIGTLPSPEYPGWMHGKLFLKTTSFLAACREIEMRFNVTIAIQDQTLESKVITGILEAGTARSALSALAELTGTRFTYDGQTYTIH